MIRSFKDKLTRAVFEGKRPKGFPADLVDAAFRRLGYLAAANELEDLKQPPGNRLHPLKGDREGQWAIRVNDQFRIAFIWTPEGPENVEFTDYH